MGISRPAADKIRRMWEAYKSQQPKGAGFADPGLPIRLAKTTVEHPAGETHDVTLLWGDKGSETEGTADRDTVPAYNRFTSFGADEEVHIAKVAGVWEIITRSSESDEDDSSSTGGCCTITGVAPAPASAGTISVTGGALAFQFHGINVVGTSGVVLMEYDGGGVWSSDDFDMLCGEDQISVHYELTVTDSSQATQNGSTGIEVIRTDGSDNYGTWRNTTQCWRPNLPTRLHIVEPGVCDIPGAPCELCIYPHLPTCEEGSIRGFSGFPGVSGALVNASVFPCNEDIVQINASQECTGVAPGTPTCTFVSNADGDWQLYAELSLFSAPSTYVLIYIVCTSGFSTVHYGESDPFDIADILDGVLIVNQGDGGPDWTAIPF